MATLLRQKQRRTRRRTEMKFFMMDGEGRKEIMVDQLSPLNLRQASVVADAVARLIPHEGVDYDVSISADGRLRMFAHTDKGEAWREYVGMELSNGDARISSGPDMKKELSALIGKLIPVDGLDYDTSITYSGRRDTSFSYRIDVRTERGKFWASYVTKMLKKYPPVPEYRADMLPENPGPVEEMQEEFKEVENEKVVS